MPIVPTIDLTRVDTHALTQIDAACRDHGFFKLIGHGLNDQIDAVLAQAQVFFAAPRNVKNEVRRGEGDAFGYFDQEITKKKRDLKEVFDYHAKAPSSGAFGDRSKPKFWLSNDRNRLEEYGLSDFEGTLKKFYRSQTELAKTVMALLCRAMGEDPNRLDDIYGDRHTSLARLNYYPAEDPIPKSERESVAELGELALGEHTDPNGVTLLYQDNAGGLQAHSSQEGWIDVPPEKHSFVINVGDIMQAWSNDRYKAAKHRVLKVPKDSSRISFPFFYMPRSGAVIKPIISGEQPRYRDIDWREFANARVADNYEVVEGEEMQLTDYRI